jgi:hypothetical protein
MAWNRDTTPIGISYDILATDKTEQASSSAVKNLGRITAAFTALTAVSAGALKAADRVAELDKVAARSAYTYSKSTDEVRNLAKEMSSAADPMDEVLASIDELSRSGVKFTSLKTVFSEFDEIGHALGEDTNVVIDEMIPALNALEIPLTDVGKVQDVFTHTVRNSNLELSELSMLISRIAPSLKTLGLGVYDVAAIYAVLQKHGIEGRRATAIMTAAIGEQEKATTSLADAQQALIDKQKELNDATLEGSRLTKYYREDVMRAGGDVSAVREISFRYRRQMEEQGVVIAAKKTEVATAQEAVTAASKPFDLVETLSKLTGGKVNPEEVQVQKDLLMAIKGETDSRAVEDEKYVTASDKAAYAMDMLNQTLGEQIDPKLAEMLPYLSIISGSIATLAGVATAFAALPAIGGGGAAAAAATAAPAAAGAGTAGAVGVGGATLAGVGAVAVPAAALVGGIVGTTLAAQGAEQVTENAAAWEHYYAKQDFIAHGGTEEEWSDYEAKVDALSKKLAAMGESAPSPEDRIGTDLAPIPLPIPKNPIEPAPAPGTTDEYAGSYKEGGIVPGPEGEPKTVTVHGGEAILPVGHPLEAAIKTPAAEPAGIPPLELPRPSAPGETVLPITEAARPPRLEYAGAFAEGGTVPGPAGQPMAATVHGGETILPIERIAAGIPREPAANNDYSIHIGTVNPTERMPMTRILDDIRLSQRRKQQGVRTL